MAPEKHVHYKNLCGQISFWKMEIISNGDSVPAERWDFRNQGQKYRQFIARQWSGQIG